MGKLGDTKDDLETYKRRCAKGKQRIEDARKHKAKKIRRREGTKSQLSDVKAKRDRMANELEEAGKMKDDRMERIKKEKDDLKTLNKGIKKIKKDINDNIDKIEADIGLIDGFINKTQKEKENVDEKVSFYKKELKKDRKEVKDTTEFIKATKVTVKSNCKRVKPLEDEVKRLETKMKKNEKIKAVPKTTVRVPGKKPRKSLAPKM